MQFMQEMAETLKAFIETRFPDEPGAGAAIMRTASGRQLISTAPETLNDSVSLCHETGCLCEAYTLDEPVVASLCLHRVRSGTFIVLAPCGVCQERLFVYGPDVQVGVADDQDPTQWQFRTLGEIQPYYWRNALRGLRSQLLA